LKDDTQEISMIDGNQIGRNLSSAPDQLPDPSKRRDDMARLRRTIPPHPRPFCRASMAEHATAIRQP
jgi:hypothetical protein